MARAAKATKAKQPPVGTRKPGRAKSAVAATSAKAAKPSPAPKRIPAATSAAPVAAKLSKDELRAQVEKLESANAALRGKSREANKAARTAAARISELEQQVAQLEKKAASSAVPAKTSVKPAKAGGAKRQSRSADLSEAMPPSVTAQKPESLDDEPGTALEGSG